ncbi:hypothetical protein BGZ75_000684 [Mortierella antarctica]|nr:hypothetical protein BGZ75_000684 [Mortierella antarctica]
MSDWSEARLQYPLSYKDHTTIIVGDGKKSRSVPILGGKVDSVDELTRGMEDLIRSTMQIRYKPDPYHQAFMQEFCSRLTPYCRIEVLTPPVIEVIPVRRLSDDILCTTTTCTIGYHDTTSVTTTHSAEVGFSATTSAKPFGMGVEFTVSASYGFSEAREESTTLSYEFNLEKGEKGYIAIVNAQISSLLRITGCWCKHDSMFCACAGPGTPVSVGHHQAVIKENNKPRSMVAFVHL